MNDQAMLLAGAVIGSIACIVSLVVRVMLWRDE